MTYTATGFPISFFKFSHVNISTPTQSVKSVAIAQKIVRYARVRRPNTKNVDMISDAADGRFVGGDQSPDGVCAQHGEQRKASLGAGSHLDGHQTGANMQTE